MRVNTPIDMFCPYHKFLLFNLVSRNVKLKYRKSYLGIFWTMLGPLLTCAIFFLVYKYVIKLTIPNFLVFIIVGIMHWTFFITSLQIGLESLVSNHSLLNKIPIPVHAFPLAEVFTCYVNYLLTLPVIMLVILLTGQPLSWHALWFPLLAIMLFIQAYSYAIILAVGFVFFRDLRHALVFIGQIWFYLTPVIYEKGMIPEKMSFVMYLNPVFNIFSSLHDIFVFDRSPDLAGISIALAWTVGAFTFAFFVINKAQNRITESL